MRHRGNGAVNVDVVSIRCLWNYPHLEGPRLRRQSAVQGLGSTVKPVIDQVGKRNVCRSNQQKTQCLMDEHREAEIIAPPLSSYLSAHDMIIFNRRFSCMWKFIRVQMECADIFIISSTGTLQRLVYFQHLKCQEENKMSTPWKDMKMKLSLRYIFFKI